MLNRDIVQELKLHKAKGIRLLLLSIGSALLTIVLAYGMAYIVERAFLEKESVENLFTAISMTLGIALLKGIIFFFQERDARHLGVAVKQALREKIINHMLALGLYSKQRQGELVHLLTDGVEQVEEYVARYVPQMIYALLTPLLMAIVMIESIPWISWILLGTYPLIPFFMILIGKSAEKLNRQQWDRMNFLSGHFLDVLQGITTLKVFGRSREQIAVIARLSGEFRDATLRVLRVAFLSAFVLELISTISTALIAVYTGVSLVYGEILFFPAFFILLLAPEFYAPLRQLGTYFHTGMAGKASIEKVVEFLALPILEPEDGQVCMHTETKEICFTDVSFTYPGRDCAAIQHFSATLTQGTKTVLVGESGAGKSTVVQLLLRLLGTDKGQITVNGTDVLQLNGNCWREQISYVSQTPHIFKGTIADNIAFGRHVSVEDIKKAAILAEAHDFIMELPDGYDTELGEGGMGLSGGQRQRIAVARAFLQESPVLVLDEAGAHLDVATEISLEKSLQRLMKGKITLIITHRLHHLERADQILVMKDGCLVERGQFAELMEKGGYFAELVTVSRGGALNEEL